MNNRRRSLRWEGNLPCHFIYGEESSTGRVANLSFEGARVDEPVKMPSRGTQIVLTLRPERENVTLKARVIYVEEGQFGVAFCGSRGENLKALRPFFHM